MRAYVQGFGKQHLDLTQQHSSRGRHFRCVAKVEVRNGRIALRFCSAGYEQMLLEVVRRHQGGHLVLLKELHSEFPIRHLDDDLRVDRTVIAHYGKKQQR